MPKSDLPFGSEFSPSQIDLATVLEFAQTHGGNWKAFENAVRKKYFDRHTGTDDYNRAKLANNCKLGMIAYGIIDRDARLTEFGQKLYELRGDVGLLYRELARQILLNLYGSTLIRTVQDLQAGGETLDLVKLRLWLNEHGVHFPRGGKHASIMRLWLEKAGVFVTGWRINEARYREILGIESREVDVLSRMNREQRFFLKTLVNLGPGVYPSNDVEKMAAATYGVRFNEKMLPKTVLYPLAEAGYIKLTRETSGRGAKPFMVAPTEKLIGEVLEPLLVQLEKQAGAELRPFLRKPLTEVVAELDVQDKHVRGLALEALAFRLMRLIDLQYVATRVRGTATGGAEVDVIFESSRLVFSRWQIQCKNTARVALDDVAKEVGLTHLLKSNVVVIVSTGEIGPEARRYANKIMSDSNLCVVMVDKGDVVSVVADPTSLIDILTREACHAMKLKALTLDA